MKSQCRYCRLPIDGEPAITHSYWHGQKSYCHKECKQPGERAEAIECQMIDADCNDCKHFKRGKLAEVQVHHSLGRHKEPITTTHQPQMWEGTCLKFQRLTVAFPNKWTGHECFEHRRAG